MVLVNALVFFIGKDPSIFARLGLRAEAEPVAETQVDDTAEAPETSGFVQIQIFVWKANDWCSSFLKTCTCRNCFCFQVDGEEVQDFGEPVAVAGLSSLFSIGFSLLGVAEVKTMRPGDGKSFPKEGDQIVMHLGKRLPSLSRSDMMRKICWNNEKLKIHFRNFLQRKEDVDSRHYSGTLAKSKDKVPFDSSYSRGKPFMFRRAQCWVPTWYTEVAIETSLFIVLQV